jgi:hypothetical protein
VSIGGNTIEEDYLKIGLKIIFPESGLIPMEERWHYGFDVGHGIGYFRVPADRWEAL